jgi:Calponin homology (CH) domain/Protein tyrosine and serine/threonine kinase
MTSKNAPAGSLLRTIFDVLDWLEDVLGESVLDEQGNKDREEFRRSGKTCADPYSALHGALKDGVALCKLVQKLFGNDALPKYSRKPRLVFQSVDNVNTFLKVAARKGFRGVPLEAEDLFHGRDMFTVVSFMRRFIDFVAESGHAQSLADAPILTPRTLSPDHVKSQREEKDTQKSVVQSSTKDVRKGAAVPEKSVAARDEEQPLPSDIAPAEQRLLDRLARSRVASNPIAVLGSATMTTTKKAASPSVLSGSSDDPSAIAEAKRLMRMPGLMSRSTSACVPASTPATIEPVESGDDAPTPLDRSHVKASEKLARAASERTALVAPPSPQSKWISRINQNANSTPRVSLVDEKRAALVAERVARRKERRQFLLRLYGDPLRERIDSALRQVDARLAAVGANASDSGSDDDDGERGGDISSSSSSAVATDTGADESEKDRRAKARAERRRQREEAEARRIEEHEAERERRAQERAQRREEENRRRREEDEARERRARERREQREQAEKQRRDDEEERRVQREKEEEAREAERLRRRAGDEALQRVRDTMAKESDAAARAIDGIVEFWRKFKESSPPSAQVSTSQSSSSSSLLLSLDHVRSPPWPRALAAHASSLEWQLRTEPARAKRLLRTALAVGKASLAGTVDVACRARVAVALDVALRVLEACTSNSPLLVVARMASDGGDALAHAERLLCELAESVDALVDAAASLVVDDAVLGDGDDSALLVGFAKLHAALGRDVLPSSVRAALERMRVENARSSSSPSPPPSPPAADAPTVLAHFAIGMADLDIVRTVATDAARGVSVLEARYAGERVAVHVADSARGRQLVFNELSLLQSLFCGHIVRLVGGNASAARPFVVLEWVERGSLRQCLPTLDGWPQRWSVAVSVAIALQYLHTRRPAVAHGAVTLDNVLVGVSGAKLGGFAHAGRGSLCSAPPDLAGRLDAYSDADDVRSYGALLRHMAADIDEAEWPKDYRTLAERSASSRLSAAGIVQLLKRKSYIANRMDEERKLLTKFRDASAKLVEQTSIVEQLHEHTATQLRRAEKLAASAKQLCDEATSASALVEERLARVTVGLDAQAAANAAKKEEALGLDVQRRKLHRRGGGRKLDEEHTATMHKLEDEQAQLRRHLKKTMSTNRRLDGDVDLLKLSLSQLRRSPSPSPSSSSRDDSLSVNVTPASRTMNRSDIEAYTRRAGLTRNTSLYRPSARAVFDSDSPAKAPLSRSTSRYSSSSSPYRSSLSTRTSGLRTTTTRSESRLSKSSSRYSSSTLTSSSTSSRYSHK